MNKCVLIVVMLLKLDTYNDYIMIGLQELF